MKSKPRFLPYKALQDGPLRPRGPDCNSARLLPRTKHAAVINQVAPCNCPVPAGDDGNTPEVPSHPKLGVAEESVTSSTDREIVPSRDPNKSENEGRGAL